LLIPATTSTGETVTKSDREIMEIFEAFDATGCAHSAAQLVGCDPKTVRRYVARRDMGGGDPLTPLARPKLIDGFLSKVEEPVDTSRGRIRADRVHERLAAMGVYRRGTHHPASGGGGEGGVAVRAAARVSAVGAGAGVVAAVRRAP
jgi:hypothetical protein